MLQANILHSNQKHASSYSNGVKHLEQVNKALEKKIIIRPVYSY